MTTNTDAKTAAQSYAGEKLMEAAKAKAQTQETAKTTKPVKTAPVTDISDHHAMEAEIARSDAKRNAKMREQYFKAKAERQAQGSDDRSAIDVHGPNKRLGAVHKVDAGAVSKAENPLPSPSLDFRNITAIEGFDDHADLLRPAARAFEIATESITAIFAARDAAASNPEWTPATQTIKTADYALKAQERATKTWDTATSNLNKTISYCEAELGKPLETTNQTVATTALAAEIRAHVKVMDHTERQKFMRNAFERKDAKTLQAVLSGPSYLSGFDMDAHDHYTRQYHEMQQPQLVSRLAAMKKARDLLDDRGPLIWSEVTRAIGSDWPKIHKLKAASNAAHAALIFNDLA